MNFESFLSILESKLKQFLKSKFGYISLGVFVFIFIFIGMFFQNIKPYQHGVKQVNIGFKRGIQDKVYNTGWHFVMPFGFEEMHTFPKNLQLFDLSSNVSSPRSGQDKAALIQTSDGFFVYVDVSFLYRITDPVTVLKTIGPGKLYETNGLVPKAEPALKDSLGKLTTEEFYNSPLRVEKMMLAKSLLNNELKEKGIQVDEVLIRYFRYSEEIQRNIEDKKLKDQLVFKNQAEARSAIEEAFLKKVTQEGEARYGVELEKGKAYEVRKLAETELYVRQKKAAGDLLVKLAEAEKTRLKNNALMLIGSKNMVGLEMAKVLDGIEVLVLPSDGADGLNPLNLTKMKGLFK